jgi:hypothetical protein
VPFSYHAFYINVIAYPHSAITVNCDVVHLISMSMYIDMLCTTYRDIKVTGAKEQLVTKYPVDLIDLSL